MISICAGSFDPVTFGHLWLIEQAASISDKVYVAIGKNPAKHCLFPVQKRQDMLEKTLQSRLQPSLLAKIKIIQLDNELLIHVASDHGATHIVRGMRDLKDFEYEKQMQQVNHKINPIIKTCFFITPSHLSEVSSSTVKGLVGFRGWKLALGEYVHESVISAFEEITPPMN